MNTYSEREKMAVKLLRKEGYTIKEVAKITGVNPATINVWLRTFNELKKQTKKN